MPDQTDDVGAAGSGTAQAVAFELWRVLRQHTKKSADELAPAYIERQLRLYGECLNATSRRPLDPTKIK